MAGCWASYFQRLSWDEIESTRKNNEGNIQQLHSVRSINKHFIALYKGDHFLAGYPGNVRVIPSGQGSAILSAQLTIANQSV